MTQHRHSRKGILHKSPYKLSKGGWVLAMLLGKGNFFYFAKWQESQGCILFLQGIIG